MSIQKMYNPLIYLVRGTGMGNSRKEYQKRIDTLFNIFIAMVSLGLALYALYVAKGNKLMTTLLSTWGCFIIAFIAFVWAIYILIQMKKLPKETEKKSFQILKASLIK